MALIHKNKRYRNILSRRNKDRKNPNKNRKTVTFSEKDFLPTTREEMDALGWDQCDVILQLVPIVPDGNAYH